MTTFLPQLTRIMGEMQSDIASLEKLCAQFAGSQSEDMHIVLQEQIENMRQRILLCQTMAETQSTDILSQIKHS